MQLKIQQYCTATGARLVFKLRPYKNFAIGLGIFAPICLLLLFCLNVWVASGIAFLLAFCVYIFLESRVLTITCPSCGHDVDTNTPWLCGYKKCRNENIDHQHPFINECEHCHYIPKAYKCHHCGEPIYLTTDRQNVHMAQWLAGQEPVKPKPLDAISEKISNHNEELRDKKHELDLEILKKQIQVVKKSPAVQPPAKTEAQSIIERVRRGVENGKTLFELERQLSEEAKASFINDPEALREMLNIIKEAIFNEKQRMSGGG